MIEFIRKVLGRKSGEGGESADKKLQQALRMESATDIQAALDAGANPNLVIMHAGGRPSLPLNEVIEYPSDKARQCGKILIDAGADPFLNKTDTQGWMFSVPIVHACRKHVDLFITMLGSPLSTSGHALQMLPRVASECAVRNMPAEGLQALQGHFEAHALSKNPELPKHHLWTKEQHDGRSLFEYVAAGERLKVLSWLLENPSLGLVNTLEDRDDRGRTFLLKTIERSGWEVIFPVMPETGCGAVRRLVSSGADVGARDNEGRNVVDLLPEKMRRSGVPVHDLLNALVSANDASLAIDRLMESASLPVRVRP